MFDGSSTSLGIDVALAVSALPTSGARPYSGLRVSFAAPADGWYSGGGISQSVIVPLGLAYTFAPQWQLLIEAGAIGALSEERRMADAGVTAHGHVGGYGALALAYVWER
jgi:hypothetical protein